MELPAVVADEPALVGADVLPVCGTDPPAPAGGGVEAPLPQALRIMAASKTTNMDKFNFFFIFLLIIFPIDDILSSHL